MVTDDSMILHGKFRSPHMFPNVVQCRSRLRVSVWKLYISERGTISSLSVDLCLSKVKLTVCVQVLLKDSRAPADTLPDHQAEPQDIALHMTYRKGSGPDLSMICMSVFFFSFLGFCYNWWKSIRGCFPITLHCTVVPAVWASPLESSGWAPWFSGLGVQTQYSLSSLCLQHCVSDSVFSWTQSSWEGSLCSTLVACCPPK